MKLVERLREIAETLDVDFENLFNSSKEILSIDIIAFGDKVFVGVLTTRDCHVNIPTSFKLYLPFAGDIELPVERQYK